MKLYKIFEHPTLPTEIVKSGWSWPAFFFTGIWVFIKKLWLAAAVIWFGFIVLGLMLSPDAPMHGFGFIVGIIFGVLGNSFRVNNLIKKGYEEKDTVSAFNVDGAVAEYRRIH